MASEIIVGLDIGTTKIVAMVGRKNEYGKLEILGFGNSTSIGVRRGVVSNIEQTIKSIKAAVQEAEGNSGVEIKNVYVGIAGQHIRSIQQHGTLMRKNAEDEITQSDIDTLTDDMHKLVMLPGEKIIHVLPQDYIIDNEKGITEPIGMCGGRMEANFHIITGQVSALKNILRCLDRSDLSSSGVILEPLASADAVLSKEEKEAGVALIDIGGGTTDIAIFHDGIIRHTAVIALGGDIITEDIKEGCSIIKDQAEMLKICHGSALASESKQNQVVVIPGLGGHKPKEISLKALASIIQARMQDIIDHVQYEIKNSGYEKKLIAGIVLTGGGAKLRNIIQFIEFFTGMNARIGYPNEHLGKSPEEVASPMYSTSIGLVLKGFEEIELRKTFFESAKSNVKGATATKNAGGGFLEGLFAKARDFFEDDSEKNS